MKSESITSLLKDDATRSETVRNLAKNYIDACAIIEDHSLQDKLLKELMKEYSILQNKVEALLKNTLPEVVADEIKYRGKFSPSPCDCTILFSDFIGFTSLAEQLSQTNLVEILNRLFCEFDDITLRHRGTKIKTAGDSYMVAFGTPTELKDHAYHAILAAMEMQHCIKEFNERNEYPFHMRVGIHSGPVIAGVVGKERLQFDVFGDNVNIASRFESAGAAGEVNVSNETYRRTKNYFKFISRGRVALKHKEDMEAYFVVAKL
ncbi:MAG: adenylate/guanylate cyclase domain-containing protein [Deltaproteobacteria bacterium]|nr:adenylate/guanylate cyclase domain-containing protein [Deltaproteobacteria bacterium]